MALLSNPEEVAAQLGTAARLIARAFATLDSAQLQRLCIYNFPAPAERPMLWLGRWCTPAGEIAFSQIDNTQV